VFREKDSKGVVAPTVDPLVVTVGIGPAMVKRVLVDCGSSVNVLFRKTFNLMNLSMTDV